jgi:radical SAM protein with 4Fe4S-binding SPASM domain
MDIRFFNPNNLNYPLYEVQLNYTEKCNSRCTTCNIWKTKKPKVLGLDAIENYLSSKKGRELQVLYLTGGEPFLDGQYAIDICKIAKKYKPDVLISGDTNGLKPEHTVEILKEIRDGLGLKLGIGVSFNGMPEVHDKTRGIVGAHDKALKFMQLLKSNNIQFAISYVVNEETVDSWDYVHSIANLYGAFVGWSLERTGERYNTKTKQTNGFCFTCPGLKTTFAISPDGGVYACDDYSNKNLCAGNLYETPFDEIDFRPVWDYIASGACQPCEILCHARKALPVLPYQMFQRQS